MGLSSEIRDREFQKFVVDGSGDTAVRTVLSNGDIEIGAVELKNASDDTRAVVKSDGTNNALVVTQNAVPNPSNLDVALSTRLKAADTLAKVSTVDTITNPVSVVSGFFAVKLTVSGSYTYVGKAVVGSAQASAAWQAFRIDESVTDNLVITWADGDSSFDNVATDLTSLSYS
jgi:hypothetical protein